MTIILVPKHKGGIFDYKEVSSLVNPVNIQGISGKGLALQFKKKYPVAYAAYRESCQKEEFEIGEIFIYRYKDERQPEIIFFPTKTDWRFPSQYDYIENGLKKLKSWVNMSNMKSISIPALGCGEGGLEWNIVKHMIIKELESCNCEIYLFPPR